MTKLEEIALAIFNERFGHCVGEHWDNASPADKRSHMDMASAAVKAIRAPNEAMIDAGLDNILTTDRTVDCDARDVWQAMIDAILNESGPGDAP